jgi:hypothetical protein
MDEAGILEHLFELARDAGMRVHIAGRGRIGADDLPLSSGVCRVRDQIFVVLSGAEPVSVQIETLAGALREHAADFLKERHLPPAVRRLIDPEGWGDSTSA